MKKNPILKKKLLVILFFALSSFLSVYADFTLTLDKIFIQGYYNGGGMMTPKLFNSGVSNDFLVVDTISIKLLDSVNNTCAEIASSLAVLPTNGICTVTFSNIPDGSYYILVSHCNALSARSTNKVAFVNGLVTTCDFSSTPFQARDPLILVDPGVYALYSGDINQDCVIDSVDINIVYIDVQNGEFGDLCTDLNGDGAVDLNDIILYERFTLPHLGHCNCGNNLCTSAIIDDNDSCTVDYCNPLTGIVTHGARPEFCGNGIDDNCNGLIDEGCPPPQPFIFTGNPRCNTVQEYKIVVTNKFIPSCILIFEADAQMTLSSLTTPPDSIRGNKYFYHLTGPHQNNYTLLATLRFLLPGPGNIICTEIKMHPIDSLGNINYNTTYPYKLCQTIRCSFDPNEKVVNPPEDKIAPLDSWLLYTIAFQNTGNDTAYDISIKDTLDPFLDLNTLKVLDSSDPYISSIDNSIATFSFNNIFLPDSNIDEPGSHGYITYLIKPLPGIINGTQVKNTAYIYFDANSPVETNTTLNIFSDNVTLNLKVFIQGFYLSNGIMIAVVDPINNPIQCDTIIVELHNASSPYGLVHSIKSTIDINGNGQFIFPGNVLTHSYYIVVRHRNSIETWSKTPVLFNGSVVNFDFTQ